MRTELGRVLFSAFSQGRTMRVDCETPTCANYQVLDIDSRLPEHWKCSACEDAIDAQMLEELEREHRKRSRPTTKERC